MRAFLALELSPPTRAALAEAIRLLSTETIHVKWVDPHQTHMTLKFFADLLPARQEDLARAMAEVARTTRPFSYDVRGLGFFASGEKLRVLWCGVQDGAGSLTALQRRIDDVLARKGFPREEKPFKPHLTLGRLREPSREPQLVQAIKARPGFEAGTERPAHLVLFSSTLTPQGPIYKMLARWAFEGAA